MFPLYLAAETQGNNILTDLTKNTTFIQPS